MAITPRTPRRGLPRVRGGDPWPPAVEDVPRTGAGETTTAAAAAPAVAAEPPAPAGTDGGVPSPLRADTSAMLAADADANGGVSAPRSVRRGLPRVAGGEPWPAVATAPPAAAVADAPVPAASAASGGDGRVAAVSAPADPVAETAPPPPPAAETAPGAAEVDGVRRGLPRVAGGEPWPPRGAARPAGAEPRPSPAPATAALVPETPVPPAADTTAPAAAAQTRPGPTVEAARANAAPEPLAASSSPSEAAAVAPRAPLPFTRTVWAGEAATGPRGGKPEPRRYGPFTRTQWAGAVVIGGVGLLFAAGMAVALVRWLLSTDPLQDFLATYPGEYALPVGAPVGLPAWLGWQHFLNTFFLLLIIRTGLQVRREKRPAVFWSPRGQRKRRISLNLWFHQALDVLWVVNGVVFLVLLFATGQWMRIVPTSWEVVPNALSAALQYVSLEWPTENGWVNYNALQQLAYFATTFVAAPLAIITGVRMSGIWPREAATLNRLYPVEWARAVHFPVMLYFVAFTAVHVFLVFATGALRNLNHMYAALGSTDPDAYADNWSGFWWFTASLVVIAAAWVAARPVVLAPIAGLFGTVKGR